MQWKSFFLLLFIFTSSFVLSQEERKIISGKIIGDTLPLQDVHLVNKNTRKGTITNAKGEFELPVKENDTLLISHINYDVLYFKVTTEHIKNKHLNISLNEKSYVLDEIAIGKKRSIFYVDKDIVPPTEVNAVTLKLPYANTKVKKDNSLLKIRSGFSISLTNIIKRINGTHKREQQAKKLYAQDKNLLKIRKHFTDDFFITDLQIKKEYINQFLNYCVSKNIIQFFKTEQKIKLTRILLEESKTFPHQQIKEETLLTKQ